MATAPADGHGTGGRRRLRPRHWRTADGRRQTVNANKKTSNYGRWSAIGGKYHLRYSDKNPLFRGVSTVLNIKFHPSYFVVGRHRYDSVSVDALGEKVSKQMNRLLNDARAFKVSFGPKAAPPATATAKDQLVGCYSRLSQREYGKRLQTVCFRGSGAFSITTAKGAWNHGKWRYLGTGAKRGERRYEAVYGTKGTFVPGKTVTLKISFGSHNQYMWLGGKTMFMRVSQRHALESRPRLRLPGESMAQGVAQLRPNRTPDASSPFAGCWLETKRAGKSLPEGKRGVRCFHRKYFWTLNAQALASPKADSSRRFRVSESRTPTRIKATGQHTMWLDGSDYEYLFPLKSDFGLTLFLKAQKTGKAWQVVGSQNATPLSIENVEFLANIKTKDGKAGGAIVYWSAIDELVVRFGANSPIQAGKTVRISREVVPKRPRWEFKGRVDKPGKGLPEFVHFSSREAERDPDVADSTPTPNPRADTRKQPTVRNDRRVTNSGGSSNTGGGGSKTASKPSGPTFGGSYVIKNDTRDKLYIWMGSGSGWLNKGSTKSASCAKGSKVYWSRTNRSGDKKLAFEATPKHCGKTTKMAGFVR